jgi:FKBP-type peptidyl-prolyl cis-trans isomerase
MRIGVKAIYSKEEYDVKLVEEAKVQLEEEDRIISEYLKSNGIDAKMTEEGVYYQIIVEGDGPIPQKGQKIKANYTGALLDGTVFDSSIEEDAKAANLYNPGRKYEPIAFALGQGEVIRGWDIGFGLLPVGAKAKFIIPSPLAYGASSRGAIIKPNSILVFDVELVEISE